MNKNDFLFGLEVHVQLNSNFKLFSYSRNCSYSVENSNVNLYDIGTPGYFPKLNVNAVQKGIKAAKMLKCKISKTVTFDRKHYRYYDLPFSYQNTQQYNPIGKDGKYKIGKYSMVYINNIHLEADAAKTKEYDDHYIIDYNRSASPLIEIVTEPCFNNYEKIRDFLNILIQDLRENNISDAKFEMSQIRVDVNMSKILDDNTTSKRLEIKNLNSITNIKKAIKLTQDLLIKNNYNEDYTVQYDDVKEIVKLARQKEKAIDYLYYHSTCFPKMDTNIFENHKEDKIKYIYDEIDNILNYLKCDNGIIYDNVIKNNYIRKVFLKYIEIYNKKNINYQKI